MLLRARDVEMFKGLKVGDDEHMVEVAHLFFTYDTLVFC